MHSFMAQLGFVVVLLGAIFAQSASAAELNDSLLRVPLYGQAVATQGQADCEVASLFNAFNMGTPFWHNAVLKLKGHSIQDKYNTFLNYFAYKPSEDYPDHAILRTTAQGTSPADLRYIAVDFQTRVSSDASQIYVGKYLIRKSKVEGLGEFARRVGTDFQASLRLRAPVVLVLGAYQRQAEGNGFGYTRLYRHAVTLVGISTNIQQAQFTIEYVDPEDGQLHRATVFEGQQHFVTFYRENGQMDAVKAIGLMATSNGHFINSPMLLVNAPELWSQDQQVTYTALEFAMGRLTPDYDYQW
jgi:hypothetical protein